MSQKLDGIFTKYNNVIISRQNEIKSFLVKHFEKNFLKQDVIDVDRINATKRIKTAGFHPELSAWRNSYENIILSSCEVIKGKEKRYDYKFYFTEEKLDDRALERIENAIDESNRLQRMFKFKEAVSVIDPLIEFVRKEKDEYFINKLTDMRTEILKAEEDYRRNVRELAQLEKKIKENRELKKYEEALENCNRIIEISKLLRRKILEKKYLESAKQIRKELEEKRALEEEIARLEEKVKKDREAKNYEEALNNCYKIIEILKLIERKDIEEKYLEIIEQIRKEMEEERAPEEEVIIEEKKPVKIEKVIVNEKKPVKVKKRVIEKKKPPEVKAKRVITRTYGELAWAPIRRLMNDCGADIVAHNAVDELIYWMIDSAEKITKFSLILTHHAHRKKIKRDDILLAEKYFAYVSKRF